MQIQCADLREDRLAKYDYTAMLTPRGWGWEHLRCNHCFCRSAWAADPEALSRIGSCHSRITLMKLRRAQPEAENWGSFSFQTPITSASSALVCTCRR